MLSCDFRQMGFFSRRPEGAGTSLTVDMFAPNAVLRHLWTLVHDPRYFCDRTVVLVDQVIHPSDPWLTRNAIKELSRFLTPSMVAFEWGSGRSTVWIARRVKRLVSVEHHPEWYAKIAQRLRVSHLSNVDYRCCASGAAREEYASQIDEFADGSFDMVLIDGEGRNRCIRHAAPKVRVGGYIVVDNADTPGYDFTPLRSFDRRSTFNGVWRTDFFRRKA